MPSPVQPSPAHSPVQALVRALPKFCQRLFLLDSDASFSAPRRLLFRSVFGPFGRAVPLRFPVLKGRLWGLVFGAQPSKPSPAQPSPAQPSPAQPSPAQPSPADSSQPSPVLKGRLCGLVFGAQLFPYLKGRLCGLIFGVQPSPAQRSPAHSPAQALVWALPKLCQRLFPIGFRRIVFGP